MASVAECYVPPQLGCEALFPVSSARVPPSPQLPISPIIETGKQCSVVATIPKDFSIPLHVDCSVEYDLPDCAKPPQGIKVEPLLMIHPAHFRRLDSMRRCPFVNNLPANNGYALPTTNSLTNNNNTTNYSCQYQQPLQQQQQIMNKPTTRSTAKSSYLGSKTKESPNFNLKTNKRWRHLTSSNNMACCPNNNNIESNNRKIPALYAGQVSNQNPSHIVSSSDVPVDHYWSACGGVPLAPKEGDTLENSSFGKYPKYRASRLRSHPYYTSLDVGLNGTPLLPTGCDSVIQGTNHNSHIISPVHAKMYSAENNNNYRNSIYQQCLPFTNV